MKRIFISIILGVFLLSFVGCDKDFVEINTNPNAILELDPNFMLPHIQLNTIIPENFYQANIVQQMVYSIGGYLLGANQDQLYLQNSGALFTSAYTNPIRNLTDMIYKTKDDPSKVNIYNMARIMRAYNFMRLVDAYGDVPYSDAGKAFLENIILPKYDKQEVIYDDILFELEDATNKLDAGGDAVTGDIFFNANIEQWKKFGNSLLLRAGMRYTKLDEAKAKAIVTKAVDPARGGVMTASEDKVFIKFNTVTQTNTWSNGLTGSERANTYAAKALVDYLKKTNDPRGKYMLVRYSNPTASLGTGPDTVLAHQYGLPPGVTGAILDELAGTNADNPPKASGAYGYSQFNRQIFTTNDPEYLITYDQTLLLMAEAVVRGYITGGAKSYYEMAVRESFNRFHDYSTAISITTAEVDAYLQKPDVAWDLNDPLKVINTQYWLASFRMFTEAWSNFRRSGYPSEVQPKNYPGHDPSIDGDAEGQIRRLVYPLVERTANKENYDAAVARMGGDNLGIRVFWDVK